MRFNRKRVAGAAMLVLAMVAGACSSGGGSKTTAGTSATTTEAKPKITIGAFDFSESAILAHIYAKALKAKGYDVTVRANLGPREVVEPAIEHGDINLYPGYAATEVAFLKGTATTDPTTTVAALNTLLAPKSLKALTASPAQDQNAFAITQKTAAKYPNLKKLSDLAPIAGQLSLGGPSQCPTRPFCAIGLKDTYGITFKTFRSLDAGGPQTKTALENGDIDVGLVFSSDGAIVAKNFIVLEDDKHLQQADNVVPVIANKVATAEVTSILDKISAALTTTDLITMNKAADIDKQDPEAVADKWVKDHGFA